jgi:hypothetical protein
MLVLKDARTNRPKLQIKLEIDINPPGGSTYELKYLDFPLPFSIYSQDLPSLFASKSHALLCRDYTKGRDWYDFIWYVSMQETINFSLLNNAINQKGPWEDQNILVTPEWFTQKLREKIISINWDEARKDIARFLSPREADALAVWSKEFFLSRVDKLATSLM